MTDRHTELHHLLSRATDGVALHGETDRLWELFRALEQRAEQAEDAIIRVRTVLAPHDWPHAQVRAAAVRAALDKPQPTT
ncbi:hypothetical protein ABZS93_11620 [Streptomyces sp900116325]|uniref:hypothetical protein n=1 Tax=Streptomyces sp. 900116325 TaxID=3154295 RepID=UPI0033BD5FF0